MCFGIFAFFFDLFYILWGCTMVYLLLFCLEFKLFLYYFFSFSSFYILVSCFSLLVFFYFMLFFFLWVLGFIFGCFGKGVDFLGFKASFPKLVRKK